MIGQSVINVKSAARPAFPPSSRACFLLFLIVVLGPMVARIPMPALVAVMIMVSIGTFSWDRSEPQEPSVAILGRPWLGRCWSSSRRTIWRRAWSRA